MTGQMSHSMSGHCINPTNQPKVDDDQFRGQKLFMNGDR